MPIFIFIAGYGYAIKENKPKPLFQTIWNLYKKVWLVLIIFFPLALYLGKLRFNAGEFLLNLSGFYFSYCGEWWFVCLYVLLEIYARILNRTGILDNKKLLVLISGVLMISGYAMKVIIPTAEKLNTIEWIPYTFLIKQPIFISGYVCKKLEIFNKPLVKRFGIVGIFTWSLIFSNIPQSFYLPIIIPCFIAAFCCMPINGIAGKGLFFLGKNSTYMWLTHSWLIYKFMQSIIYGLHDIIANLCVLLVIDLVISCCFKNVEFGIDKGWKTIGNILQAVSNKH